VKYHVAIHHPPAGYAAPTLLPRLPGKDEALRERMKARIRARNVITDAG
jgi:hypothetical protein